MMTDALLLVRVTTEKWISSEKDEDGNPIGHVPSMRRGREKGAGSWVTEWVVHTELGGRVFTARTSYIDRGSGPFPPSKVAGIFDRLEARVRGEIELEAIRARKNA